MTDFINELPLENAPVQAEVAETDERGLIDRARSAIRYGQWTLAMLEVMPTNELIRLGLFGAGEATSRNPLAGAVTIGLSTFVLETVGGLAAAGLLDNDTKEGQKLTSAVVSKSQSMHIPFFNKDIQIPQKLSRPTRTAFTFIGGTVIGMGLKQREDPNRSKARNRVYSIGTSAWLGGSVAIPGYLAAEGINTGLNNPLYGGLIAGGLASTAAAGRWAYKRFSRSKQEEQIETEPVAELATEAEL